MCTLVFAWQVFTDTPVVAAANRDELLDRPSRPPALIEESPRVLAPRDEAADGTWIGYNEHGVFVAITNRWVDREADRSEASESVSGEGRPASRDDEDAPDRSRGLLVRDALREPSAEAATRHVESELDDRRYDGFNLVLADENAALFVEWDGETRRVRNFDPGVHVVVNVGADGEYAIPAVRADAGEAQAQNADEVAMVLQPEPGETSTAWLDRAADVIADHEYGVCVHHDRFGTRSSSLVEIGREASRYRYADGPPCETGYRDVDSQI
ncbi:NRDE family protein [Halosimplex salinum]|uniref:NRDE family protein n=1 Tax=Halosimplex salinum TaxID=1710538 RepID=UPI000F48DB16|nr:NRDE family protein [Halosimplex salinum]